MEAVAAAADRGGGASSGSSSSIVSGKATIMHLFASPAAIPAAVTGRRIATTRYRAAMDAKRSNLALCKQDPWFHAMESEEEEQPVGRRRRKRGSGEVVSVAGMGNKMRFRPVVLAKKNE